MKYSSAFKDAVVKHALQSSDPQKLIAQNKGVGYSILQKWLRQYRQSGNPSTPVKAQRPADRDNADRLDAVIETAAMGAAEKAAWCRTKGGYPHHLV